MYAQQMTKKIVSTQIGDIAVFYKTVGNSIPVIFLHGVYFDHHLWDDYVAQIQDRTVISIDMPMHGESTSNVKGSWTLDDCANMLLEILDTLQITKAFAIGHSWGSMTILRACHKSPTRFQSVGFCNMPWQSGANQRIKFSLQHTMLPFRGFYTKQAAKFLFGKHNLKESPQLHQALARPMKRLSNKALRQIDKAVIVNAKDASLQLQALSVIALALIGEDDYLTPPPFIHTQITKGGHVSPLQAKDAVSDFIRKVLSS
jgi:3-oxoadipate enol-lactonase